MSEEMDDIGDIGLVLGHAGQSLRMRFGLLHRDHHSPIARHSPGQPLRTSSSSDHRVGPSKIGDRISVFAQSFWRGQGEKQALSRRGRVKGRIHIQFQAM
jgi:hypothetical protein